MKDLPVPDLKLLRISWRETAGDWKADVTVAGAESAEAKAMELFKKLEVPWTNVVKQLKSSEKK